MQLKPIAANQTELISGNTHVLFSYETPVAACINGEGFYRTEKHWSSTTSRHINKWLDGATATEKPQKFFDTLIN